MKINSVRGAIDSSELGFTLMHEHLVSIDNNMRITFDDWLDEDRVIEDFVKLMEPCKKDGMKTFVEASPINLGRDVKLIRRAAEAADINILVCTGLYWVEDPWYNDVDPDILAGYLLREIENGIQDTDIKPAFIKCSSDQLYGESETNKNMIRAAAYAAIQSGLPVYTHSNNGSPQGLYQQKLLLEEGVAPHKIAIGHAFGAVDLNYLREVMDAGSYVACDQLGYDGLFNDIQVLADMIAALCSEGYSQYIFLSHDVNVYSDFCFALKDFRRDRRKHIICGDYRQLFEILIPLLKERGVSQYQIDDMTIYNPQRYFEGTAPKKAR